MRLAPSGGLRRALGPAHAWLAARFPLCELGETSWKRVRVRDEIVRDWRPSREHAALDASLVEAALAFGHAARSAFCHYTSSATLSPQLRVDWIGLGRVRWDQIGDIVRHAWSRAEAR